MSTTPRCWRTSILNGSCVTDAIECAGLRNANAYVYIHTRTSGGKLIVSTERMILSSGAEEAAEAWSAQSQVDKATDSYNVETPVMLALVAQLQVSQAPTITLALAVAVVATMMRISVSNHTCFTT
jgi:hypothetical protein